MNIEKLNCEASNENVRTRNSKSSILDNTDQCAHQDE